MTQPPDIAFRRVKEPWGWLGNMAPYKVNEYGYEWPTTEHLFQAMRFKSAGIRAEIRRQASPMGAKLTSKKFLGVADVVPRSPEDLDNMRVVLRLKLEQHPDLRAKLASTKPSRLIEDVSARPNESGLFWGMKWVPAVWTPAPLGYAVPEILVSDGHWEGENWLGRMWMELRDA